MARRGLLLSRGDERALRGRGWSVPLAEETSDGGTPHKDKDPVKAERGGRRGAEGGGCEPGGDGEITHGRGEQQGHGGGTPGPEA
jgi:hypothetical protein